MTIMEELSLVINQPDDGKFLQKIGWNKEQIKEAVSEITKQYTGLTYTEEQMQDAKKDRATLNAMRKDISDRRIQVKKALMAPYEAFEAEVKEVVTMIDEPIAMIDEQLLAYEEKVKEDKKQELVDYFKSNIGDLDGVLTFDMIFNPKWLNKTASMKSCKEEIDREIERTGTDLRAIETMIEEKYRAYAKDYYFRNDRNMTTVLSEVGRMKEIDRKAEEERQAREEAEERRREQEAIKAAEANNPPTEQENTQEQTESVSESAENVSIPAESVPKQAESVPEQSKGEKVVDPFADKDTDTKIYKASFTVRGTKAQILSVKEFMIKNNIQFGKVEK